MKVINDSPRESEIKFNGRGNVQKKKKKKLECI